MLVLSAVGEGLAAVSCRTVTQNGSRFSAKRREEVSSESCSHQDFVPGVASRARILTLAWISDVILS